MFCQEAAALGTDRLSGRKRTAPFARLLLSCTRTLRRHGRLLQWMALGIPFPSQERRQGPVALGQSSPWRRKLRVCVLAAPRPSPEGLCCRWREFQSAFPKIKSRPTGSRKNAAQSPRRLTQRTSSPGSCRGRWWQLTVRWWAQDPRGPAVPCLHGALSAS